MHLQDRHPDSLIDTAGNLAAFLRGKVQDLVANEGEIRRARAADAMDFFSLLPVAVGVRVADDGLAGGPEFADSGQHRHHLRWVGREAVAAGYCPVHALRIIRCKSERYSGPGRVPHNHGALDFQGVKNV